MKVTAVTPTDAAADPAHPDHDRWVKETTLKVEVEHAKRIGRSFRDAETENAYWLQRAEAKAREAKSVLSHAPRKPRQQRLAERGVTIGPPRKEISILKLSPCGRCGTCQNCMRERRVLSIMQKRKDDAFIAGLATRLVAAAFAHSTHSGKFFELSKQDADRMLTGLVEEVCNQSVPKMGDWKAKAK